MNEQYGRAVSWENLLLTVELAPREVSQLWPEKRVPGDRDRLKPVTNTVLDHIELLGMRCFGRPPGCGPMVAHPASPPAEEVERLRYSGSVGAIPLSSAAKRWLNLSRISLSSRSTARRAACNRSGSGGALRGSYMRGMTVARA